MSDKFCFWCEKPINPPYWGDTQMHPKCEDEYDTLNQQHYEKMLSRSTYYGFDGNTAMEDGYVKS